ncbi:MAG: c-type cytochrome [Hyphomicrobiaceae bacterium]
MRNTDRRTTFLSLVIITLCQPAFAEPDRHSDRKEGAIDGRELLADHGCGACHLIPALPGATGRAGPSLDEIGSKAYIAGVLPNTPSNLAAWIRDPQRFKPTTAMPDLDVSGSDARGMAAYLSTLKGG